MIFFRTLLLILCVVYLWLDFILTFVIYNSTEDLHTHIYQLKIGHPYSTSANVSYYICNYSNEQNFQVRMCEYCFFTPDLHVQLCCYHLLKKNHQTLTSNKPLSHPNDCWCLCFSEFSLYLNPMGNTETHTHARTHRHACSDDDDKHVGSDISICLSFVPPSAFSGVSEGVNSVCQNRGPSPSSSNLLSSP